MNQEPTIDPKEILPRILELVTFAKSILHQSFPMLEKTNPSFSMLQKYCELLAIMLKKEAKSNSNTKNQHEHEIAEKVAEFMGIIALSIVERDDSTLIDMMAILDQFLDQNRHIGK